jgi:transcription elongation factor GreA
MIEKVPMTPQGLERLRTELQHLKEVERPAISKAIGVARDHGDLKENAEYHAAKERQGFIEGRIKEIESGISRAEVIDPSKINSSRIAFGATVTLAIEDTEDEVTYQIIGPMEAKFEEGTISITAPLARALIGKEAGDEVTVNRPGGGQRVYEIIDVTFK